MDLGSIDLGGTSTLELVHPVSDEPLLGDDKKPLSITLVGDGSAVYRKKNKSMQDARMNKMSRGKKQSILPTERESCELLAECTTGWHNIELDGKPIEFSKQAAFDLYMNPKLFWIREQVDKFMGDRSNFFTSK